MWQRQLEVLKTNQEKQYKAHKSEQLRLIRNTLSLSNEIIKIANQIQQVTYEFSSSSKPSINSATRKEGFLSLKVDQLAAFVSDRENKPRLIQTQIEQQVSKLREVLSKLFSELTFDELAAQRKAFNECITKGEFQVEQAIAVFLDNSHQNDDELYERFKKIWAVIKEFSNNIKSELRQVYQSAYKAGLRLTDENAAMLTLFSGIPEGEQDGLEFKTWYPPEVCQFLLGTAPNNANCLRIGLYDNDTPLQYAEQLTRVSLTSTCLNRRIVFVGKQLGNASHFISGILHGMDLLLFDPVGYGGTPLKKYVREALEALKKRNYRICLIQNRLQRSEFETEGLVSCGPLAVEFGRWLLGLSSGQLDKLWQTWFASERTCEEGQPFWSERIKTLPTELQALENATEVEYRDSMLRLRAQHQVSIIEDQQGVDARAAQTVFTDLYLGTRHVLDIHDHPDFKVLEQHFGATPSVQDKPVSTSLSPAPLIISENSRILSQIPRDVWGIIFSYLNHHDLGILLKTCKFFYHLIPSQPLILVSLLERVASEETLVTRTFSLWKNWSGRFFSSADSSPFSLNEFISSISDIQRLSIQCYQKGTDANIFVINKRYVVDQKYLNAQLDKLMQPPLADCFQEVLTEGLSNYSIGPLIRLLGRFILMRSCTETEEDYFNFLINMSEKARTNLLFISGTFEQLKDLKRQGISFKNVPANAVFNFKNDKKTYINCVITAVWYHNSILVTALLESLTPEEIFELIEAEDKHHQNVLHIAAENSTPEVLKILLDKLPAHKTGIAKLIEAKDKYGCNILHVAASNSNSEVLKILLDKLPPDELVKLVQLIREKDKCGRNVLHIAANNSNSEVLKTLLDKLPPGELVKLIQLEGDANVLHIAAGNRNPKVLKVLLDKLSADKTEIVKLIERKDGNGWNVLHIAANNSNSDVLKTLLDKLPPGELVKLIQLEGGANVLHIAANNSNSDVLKILLNELPSKEIVKWIEAKDETKEGYGSNVLHVAAFNSNSEVLKILLMLLLEQLSLKEKTIELIKVTEKYGCRNALHIAAGSNKSEALEILMNKLSPDEIVKLIEVKDNCKRNVLHIAAENYKSEVLKIVLDKLSPDESAKLIEERDDDYSNVLHMAANNPNPEILKIVLGKLSDTSGKLSDKFVKLLEVKDRDGQNVLHIAAENNKPEALEVLLSYLEPDKVFELSRLDIPNQNTISKLILSYPDSHNTAIKILAILEKLTPNNQKVVRDHNRTIYNWFASVKNELPQALCEKFEALLEIVTDQMLRKKYEELQIENEQSNSLNP